MNIKQQLRGLPAKPGVYLFKDAAGNILYVGKAKNLRSRVKSYFRAKINLDPAKQKMLPKIASAETIITDTETEALILEANLIRQYQPPYNIVLRDDKYFLYIKITTNEKIPRVFPVRRLKSDKARYLGPYSSARSVRATLRLLRRLFPHQGEKISPREKVFPHSLFHKNKPRPPREARQSEVGTEPAVAEYNQNIANVIRFLKGDRQRIIDILESGMNQASRHKQFERAAIFRDQLNAITRLDNSQKVCLPSKESFDVLSLASNPNQSAINVFSVRQGKLIGKNTFLLKHPSSTPRHDIMNQFIVQYYNVSQDNPKKVLVPFPLKNQPSSFHIPKRGRKKQLIKMGEKSARLLLNQETDNFASAIGVKQALKELTKIINIKNARRIEIYDISNIQGQYTTGSMAVFIDGQPDKSQYRKFRLCNTGNRQDDCAMLEQILSRRFSKRHKDWPLPRLILIDGGLGQRSAAQKALKNLGLNLPVVSLAKRKEELFISGQQESVRLPYDSLTLYLIQRMRDEAHRFAVSYHKLLRRRQQRKSILDEITGFGPKTKKKLLNHFGSLKIIRRATDKALTKIIGSAKTKTLRDYL
ncbi:MAG: excinuclease ABC subunit UvrC [bacterium]